jgi:hypothetical protein
VLEALVKDVAMEIVDRKRANRPVTEPELKGFLAETSEALAFAHLRVSTRQEIAHRDVKPQNIFMDKAGHFKVGDFGCFFQQKATVHTSGQAGTLPFMSPQQRLIIAGQELQYDAYKSDVYSLGMTSLALGSLTLPSSSWPLEGLEERAGTAVRALSCSKALQDLLLTMLASNESSRPSMQVVCSQVSGSSPLLPPTIEESKSPPIRRAIPSEEDSKTHIEASISLAHISDTEVWLLDYPRKAWNKSPLSQTIAVDSSSRCVWLDADLFTCGGNVYLGHRAENSNQAYRLAAGRRWTVTRVADLIVSRKEHGLYWYAAGRKVVVFGGSQETLQKQSKRRSPSSDVTGISECEELSIATGTWRKLEGMQYGRFNFNPCEYKGYVYLCGAGTIESFKPDTSQFLRVSLSLPEPENSYLLAVVRNQLVAISGKHVIKWEGEGLRVVSQTQHREIMGLNCEMSPGVDEDREMLVVTYAGSCYGVKLDGSQKVVIIDS